MATSARLECVELLKEADIVVTNPPFSLFREYVAQLVKYDKKFVNDILPAASCGVSGNYTGLIK